MHDNKSVLLARASGMVASQNSEIERSILNIPVSLTQKETSKTLHNHTCMCIFFQWGIILLH